MNPNACQDINPTLVYTAWQMPPLCKEGVWDSERALAAAAVAKQVGVGLD